MDRLISKVEGLSLSIEDIMNAMNHQVRVWAYSSLNPDVDLAKYFENDCMVVLYPASSALVGHWVCLWIDEKRKTLNFQDSYGLDIDEELRYSSYASIDNVRPVLKQMFLSMCKRYNLKPVINTYKFQQFKTKTNVNTCGRWCIVRLKLRFLSQPDFIKLFKNNKYTPDALVSLLTLLGTSNAELPTLFSNI